MKKLVLFISALFLAASAFSSPVNISAQQGDTFNAVIVEKNKKKLHLVRVKGHDVSVIKTVNVLTGKGKGDKQVSGDAKTPEGLYHVMGFLSGNRLKEMYGDLGKIYGYGAYPLNYPNAMDNLKGKTGGGIWLHGVEDHRPDPETKGCVAFDNNDVRTVGGYLSKGTPVVITENAMYGTSAKASKLFSDARNFVLAYLTAWQNNDFNKFNSSYSRNFLTPDGSSISSYLNKKKKLMESYPARKIAADKFRVFYENMNEAVVEFNQYYSAKNTTSFGRKTLYLKREGGGLRIVAEDFQQTKGWEVKPDMEIAKADIREPELEKTAEVVVAKAVPVKPEPVKPAPVKPEPAKTETFKPAPVTPEPVKPEPVKQAVVAALSKEDLADQVNSMLEGWSKAWASRDIDSYIAYYDDSFSSGRMNKDAWKRDKQRKFARLHEIKVGVENVIVSVLGDNRYEVVFLQRYKGDNFSDSGIKTLRVVNTQNGLRIAFEDFVMIKEPAQRPAPVPSPAPVIEVAKAPAKQAAEPQIEIVKPEPVKHEQVKAEPVKEKKEITWEPVKIEKTKQTDPVKAEPVMAETVKPVPAKPAPVKVEPVKPAPVKETVVEPKPIVVAEPVKQAKPAEEIIEHNIHDISANVSDMIAAWKKAWESRNIDDYIAFYDDSFKEGGMNRDGWKKDKQRKFSRLTVVSVEMENMEISVQDDERIEVTFLQRYRGNNYRDTGVKTMRIVNTDKGLRIVSEKWRAE